MKARWSAWVAFVVLAVASLAVVGSTPNARREMGAGYRWMYYNDKTGGSATMVRFPRFADVIPVSAESTRSVNWVHVALIKAQANANGAKIIVYGDAYVGGSDTLWVTNLLRTVTEGGHRIDSLKINQGAGTNGDENDVTVYVTD